MMDQRTIRRSQTRLGVRPSVSVPAAEGVERTVSDLRGLRRALAAVALVAVVFLGYRCLTAVDYRIGKVTVQGNRNVSVLDIGEAAGVTGENVFSVNSAAVAQRIQTLAGVKSASVQVRLPNRVVITVQERSPATMWESGGTQYLVDAEGVVLEVRAATGEYVLIQDTDGRPLEPGQRVDARAVRAAQGLALLIPRELGRPPKVIEYSRDHGITILTQEGWQACFGFGENLPRQIATFKAVAEMLAQQGKQLEFIDLRFEQAPFYRERPVAKARN